MNVDFASQIVKQMHHPRDAGGSLSTFLEHPLPSLRSSLAVPLGIVMEHRFAFCHWIKLKHDLLRKNGMVDDASFDGPDLISFDWHDDFGVPDDYDEKQLEQLNQADETEVAFFAWAALRAMNDGHIRPAVWLNAVANVYIVLKQGWDDPESRDELIEDRFGKEHRVYFFQTPKQMVKTFLETHSNSGVIWDLDLDYLTQDIEVDDRWFTPLLSNRQIKTVLSPKSIWMQAILSRLRAITIAIEPEYTGGLVHSLRLFEQWEKLFFESSVFEKECHWKEHFTDSFSD